VKIPEDLNAREDLMRVHVKGAGDKELARLDVPIAVQGLARPRFSYALFIDDGSGGNGDGLLQVGESVNLVVQIKNTGDGIATQPTALLKNLGGPGLFIETGRQTLGELKPGAASTARFSFRVRDANDGADMRLQVFDAVMGDYLLERLRFPIRARGEAAKPSAGVVRVGKDDVAVLAAADNESTVLARAKAGAKLAAVAEVGGYVRVRAGDLVGYVAAADVAKAAGVVPKGVPKGLSTVYGRDPPRLQFSGVAAGGALRVPGDTYRLKVRVTDDTPVRDLYVFNEDQKVFYELLDAKTARDATVELDLKLKPGVNIVTVVAREDDEFAQREVITVFSEQGDAIKERRRRWR
jgi:hypothetical protein